MVFPFSTIGEGDKDKVIVSVSLLVIVISTEFKFTPSVVLDKVGALVKVIVALAKLKRASKVNTPKTENVNDLFFIM